MNSAARISPARLGDIVGAEQVVVDPALLEAYAVDGVCPAAVARPGAVDEVIELVRFAAAENLAVIATGARTKLSIGMPPQRYDLAIDMERIDRLIAYDPGDLTLGVEAGLPLAKLAPLLKEHRQFLPLAVPYMHRTTIGGTIASGVDTPLRHAYGTARDYVLGMEFVTGAGLSTKSGGRVVKNVTGYDLHKLMIGALGTLGILLRVNFRTFPAPHASRGFLASFSAPEGAFDLRQRIARSPLAPVTLEILSPELTQIFSRPAPTVVDAAPPLGSWFPTNAWLLAAGFGGDPPVLDRYARELTRMAEEAHTTFTRVLDDSERPSVWGRLRECLPILLESSPATAILKFSTLPGQFGSLLEQVRRITERHALPHTLLLRGSGVGYLALLPAARNKDSLNRLALACKEFSSAGPAVDYRVVIPWCPAEIKKAVDVWGPTREDFPLMQKLKAVFDPQGILAPGRFLGGL
jgi:glycolate oxidase FAD binding subunit